MKTEENGLNLQNASETKVANEFPIVGIGASAGGLDPIRKLLDKLPVDTGMSFVVIQHLAQGQESMLPEILSRSTKMKVLQVEDGMTIEQDHVYVITPGVIMTLKNGFLKLIPKGMALKPIDAFLISLSSELKTQAIGIVLSGTGNDGTEGLRAIKAEGGITFAQDPETAQYTDMPRNAIAAETVHFVLSPENIAKEIVSIAKNPHLTRIESQTPETAKDETDLKKILTTLRTAFGVDFTHYKETTINRRIARRMVINKIESMNMYVAILRKNSDEQQNLFDDLLIGVTSFFREPETFSALREKVFPEIVKDKQTNDTIRAWVPGCSTGEEVYSLAMALQEFLEEKNISDLRLQFFGTDANEKNIEKARQGVYPKTIEDNVSENRLKRFFTCSNGNYQITKLVRDICIFAKQDLTSDPPFSNLDLIVCRNVLIYFDSVLHDRIFPIFHYGLKPNGFLVLGEAESIGKFQHLFEPTTPKGIIYKKKRTQPQAFWQAEKFVPYSAIKKTSKIPEKANSLILLKEEVDRLLISEYVPATLLVNNNLDVLVFRGQVNPYLTHESGTASLNLTKIMRKELRSEIQTVIYRARKENKVLKATVDFINEGQNKTVNVQVKPLRTSEFEEPFFLITIEEAMQHSHENNKFESTGVSGGLETAKDKQIRELGEDLESTKQSLQTIIEVHEATNEELRSTMEEAQSSNEELQSTNEELETAKEELQSSNEELQTLNEELRNRNQALGHLNDDLGNLLENVNVAVVMVDNSLKIRRLTSLAQELLKIFPADVGRPITSIHLGLQIKNFERALIDVINKLTSLKEEIEGLQGHWYEMQIRPYLTAEKKIDGAILSFLDITDRKQLENVRKQHTENLENQVVEQSKELVQSERFAAIGATAAMVGHDIRNPLQAIASNIYLAKTDLAVMPEGDEKEGLKESLGGIEKNTEYINKVVQDLQDFVKPLRPTMQEMDLEKLCQEVLFKNVLPKNIDASCNVEKEAKRLITDPAMLQRILSNLVNNAVQAMPEGGKIGIDAFQEANNVVIIVQDTGAGIPEAIKPKLFTPLFTTKSTGQGLGLVVIKRMIVALCGNVSFESEVGKGTKFIIRLPSPKS